MGPLPCGARLVDLQAPVLNGKLFVGGRVKSVELAKVMEELGVNRDSFRVPGLLPLVYVAWADGHVQRSERKRIQKAAARKGWLREGGAALLETWLEEPPSSEYVQKGFELLRALAADPRGAGAGVHAEAQAEADRAAGLSHEAPRGSC